MHAMYSSNLDLFVGVGVGTNDIGNGNGI